MSDLALLLGALQDPLFDGALTDEAINSDLLSLTQPVRAVHCLLVHRGVPVAVVEDNLEVRTGKFVFLYQTIKKKKINKYKDSFMNMDGC